MRPKYHQVLSIAACLFLTSCAGLRAAKDASSRFDELRAAGKLPGFTPEEHGRLHAVVSLRGRPSYPASEIVFAKKRGDSAAYGYKFVKDDGTAEWRLVEAWRKLKGGGREELNLE
ncbi:MAG: hypothetical protein QOJ40_1024 [Verrucomicrobiota bacterium]